MPGPMLGADSLPKMIVSCVGRRRRYSYRSACAGNAGFSSQLAPLARARVALLVATRQVIRNALAVLGVSAPDRMDRDTNAQESP